MQLRDSVLSVVVIGQQMLTGAEFVEPAVCNFVSQTMEAEY